MRAKQLVKYHFQVESKKRITGVYFSSNGSWLACVTVLSDEPEPNGILDAWHTSTGVKISNEEGILQNLGWGFDPESIDGSNSFGYLFTRGGAHLVDSDRGRGRDRVINALGF